MTSLIEMANGYIEQLKFRIVQSENQLNELRQHLQECENEIRFGTTSFAATEQTSCDNSKEKECCHSRASEEDLIPTVSLMAPSPDESDTNQ